MEAAIAANLQAQSQIPGPHLGTGHDPGVQVQKASTPSGQRSAARAPGFSRKKTARQKPLLHGGSSMAVRVPDQQALDPVTRGPDFQTQHRTSSSRGSHQETVLARSQRAPKSPCLAAGRPHDTVVYWTRSAQAKQMHTSEPRPSGLGSRRSHREPIARACQGRAEVGIGSGLRWNQKLHRLPATRLQFQHPNTSASETRRPVMIWNSHKGRVGRDQDRSSSPSARTLIRGIKAQLRFPRRAAQSINPGSPLQECTCRAHLTWSTDNQMGPLHMHGIPEKSQEPRIRGRQHLSVLEALGLLLIDVDRAAMGRAPALKR